MKQHGPLKLFMLCRVLLLAELESEKRELQQQVSSLGQDNEEVARLVRQYQEEQEEHGRLKDLHATVKVRGRQLAPVQLPRPLR